jgi:hypothetical protein
VVFWVERRQAKALEIGGLGVGSSGTSSFSDYPGSRGGSSNGGSSKGKGGDGGGDGGGGSTDECAAAINDALEDVATSAYYAKHGKVPPPKTKVRIRSKLVGGRVAVETVADSEVIGNLPTKYNYVVKCMKQSWTYEGTVESSSAGRLPKVTVDLGASM